MSTLAASDSMASLEAHEPKEDALQDDDMFCQTFSDLMSVERPNGKPRGHSSGSVLRAGFRILREELTFKGGSPHCLD